MSHDSSNKTEKPTPRRWQKAREDGQVAKSQDLNSAIVLGAAALSLIFIGPYTVGSMQGMLQYTFLHLSTQPLTTSKFGELISQNVISLIWLMMPLLIGVSALATLSNLIQVKPLWTLKPLEPKLDKINPVNGFKRLWSLRSMVEVLKALIKMTVIGGGGYFIIKAHLDELMITMLTSLTAGWSVVGNVIGLIALWSVSAFFVLGLADYLYQRYELEKQLRMTRQEVKDERKNQEGDPLIKNKVRQMGIRISRNKQLAQVATADVIVTNPTHFAIALKYDPDRAPAPIVIAKGQDHFALKIKEVAKEAGIPTIENKPLARSLYKMAELDAMIPPELFVAVAEVLAFVFSKNKGRHLKKRLKNSSGNKLSRNSNPRPANG